MELRARDRCVRFPRRPLIMGIVNINDDSFFVDGLLDFQWAMEKARELVTQGADIVDVGGESARSNRAAITPEEELRRILPFLERFDEVWRDVPPRDAEQVFPPLLSVNTWRPEVAAIALRSSGHLLNDLSALHDDENAHLCAQTGAALLIIHAVGLPKVSHTHILYQNIIDEMLRFFRDKILLAERAGVPRDAIVLDPGIDVAKQVDDNLRIFRELDRFHQFGRPLLLPVSRKSVIGEVLGIADPNDRDAATAACIVAGMLRGACLFRVHNVEMAWRVVVSIHRLVAA